MKLRLCIFFIILILCAYPIDCTAAESVKQKDVYNLLIVAEQNEINNFLLIINQNKKEGLIEKINQSERKDLIEKIDQNEKKDLIEKIDQNKKEDLTEKINQNEKEALTETINNEEQYDMVSSQLQEYIEYGEIQDVIDDSLGKNTLNFKDIINDCMNNKKIELKEIIKKIFESIVEQINNDKNMFTKVIILGLISAVFSKFSEIFKNGCISETGFNLSYMMVFTLLMGTFSMAYLIAEKTIGILLKVITVIIPTYALAIGMCNGTVTSIAFYDGTIILISIVNWLYLKVVLPLINAYVMIIVANNITEEDMLSQFAKLLKKIIKWSQKTLLSSTVIVQVIRQMATTNNNGQKNKIMMNIIESIPAIGNTIISVRDTFEAAASMLRNAVGVGGIIVIIIICVIPIAKILCFSLTYYVAAATIQPVSDRRMVRCISGVGDGAQMLVEITISTMILFVITLALVAY